MREFINRITRPCRKITDNIIIATVLSLVIMVLGSILSGIMLNLTGFRTLLSNYLQNGNLEMFLSSYLEFLGIWIAVLLFTAVPKSNRPMLKSFWYNRNGNNLKGIIAGILLGFGTNSFCVLMSWLSGNIKFSYYGFEPVILLMFIAAIFIQSGAEELMDRYYLYEKLRRRYASPLVAILVNSLVFMLLHIPNPGFTAKAGSQIFLIGVIFSLLVYYYDSLWAAIWFHTTWNFTQNIIFGLPNSGIVSEYSIFKLEAVTAQSGLFYDVKFGVEGSIGSSLVLLALLTAIILMNRNKPEKSDVWAQAEEKTAAKAAEAEENAPKHAAHN